MSIWLTFQSALPRWSAGARLASASRACVAVALTALLAAACGTPSSPESSGPPPEIGKRASSFRLPSLEGAELGPEDFRGKVVVVDFWATWCGPCKLQAEILHELHEEYAESEVQFLAVDVGEDAETVLAYVKETPFPYPVLLDESSDLMYDLGFFGLPTVLVLDTQGGVSYLEVGVAQAQDLRQLIEEAGGEGKVS